MLWLLGLMLPWLLDFIAAMVCGVSSSEFFADNKHCYDTAFNVALKFVDFVLHCNSKQIVSMGHFSALGR